jgi:hypothetical protein
MKTVSISVDEATWESLQALAHVGHLPIERVIAQGLSTCTARPAAAPPAPEQRRAILSSLWADLDACNVEVGEKPTRARTYDHRRFHRY